MATRGKSWQRSASASMGESINLQLSGAGLVLVSGLRMDRCGEVQRALNALMYDQRLTSLGQEGGP
eukprot:8188384-Pyramimonas_sp.AAC.1